jgi:hypothetical protein
MAHLFIQSLEVDKTFCLVAHNLHANLPGGINFSRSTTLNHFRPPPTYLPLSVEGGSEKWFSPHGPT